MATHYIPYERPTFLFHLSFDVDQLRVELSHKIHSLNNRRSTAAFMDAAMVYLEPAILYELAVKAMPGLDYGDAPEHTNQRRRVVESVVRLLRVADGIEESLLRSGGHYCGKFRLCIGRGLTAPIYKNLWLVPIRPDFFWGQEWPQVDDVTEVVQRRRLTGLADLLWVASLKGGAR